jgi:hypothetical protein
MPPPPKGDWLSVVLLVLSVLGVALVAFAG